MDLSIEFECPECRKVQPLKIADLSLGKRRGCLDCGAATELTEGSLEALQRSLQELPMPDPDFDNPQKP